MKQIKGKTEKDLVQGTVVWGGISCSKCGGRIYTNFSHQCPTPSPKGGGEKWEKNFDLIFGSVFHACKETRWKRLKCSSEIKSFISSLLHSNREEWKKELVEKIEKLKIGNLGHYEKFAQALDGGARRDGHDEAIDQIISLIQEA